MSRYLDMVDSPEHVKKLTPEQLTSLAEDVREELITKLAKAGGHLGPNLGVVELTIAMHRVFSTPKDKFVWDVSHQSYVHKLFTGRKARFQSIRTTGGLNGFSLRTESEHDCYGAGHAGTALSAALGMCAARDQRKSGEHVVCIFGDAALTNGISFGFGAAGNSTVITASVSRANSSPRVRPTLNTTAPSPMPNRAASTPATGSVQRKGQSSLPASTAVVYMPMPKNAPWPKEK